MDDDSSYSDSKFYERMSQLQEEVQGYESQKFRLEEEFQGLWTQGTSSILRILPLNLGFGPNSTTTFFQSQLQPSPTIYVEYIERERRRTNRNRAILEKLQELETSASSFAARSERLRIMRNEYERKYAAWRKFSTRKTLLSSNYPEMKSIGVNTEIVGPIFPAALSNVDISQTSIAAQTFLDMNRLFSVHQLQALNEDGIERSIPNMDKVGQHTESHDQAIIIASNPQGGELMKKPITSFPDISSDSELLPTKNATFLDLLSTSESAESKLHLNKNHQDQHVNRVGLNEDDTSVDTSFSTSRWDNAASSLKDALHTDSMGPIIPRHEKCEPSLRRLNAMKYDFGLESAAGVDRNEKCLIRSDSTLPVVGTIDKQQLQNDHEFGEEEDSIVNDCTSHSVGYSVMDSICNKTPDSLPRDDSILSRVEEECYVFDDQHHENNKNDTTISTSGKRAINTDLINEMNPRQSQSTQEHGSSQFNDITSQRKMGESGSARDIAKSIDHQQPANVMVESSENHINVMNVSPNPEQGIESTSRYRANETKMEKKDYVNKDGNSEAIEGFIHIYSPLENELRPPYHPSHEETKRDVLFSKENMNQIKTTAKVVTRAPEKLRLKVNYDDESETSPEIVKNKRLGTESLDSEFADFFG